MRENNYVDHLLSREAIKKQLTAIKEGLQRKCFRSTYRSNWTIDMAIAHFFGNHGKYGPEFVGLISLQDKKLWLNEIIGIIEKLKFSDEELVNPVFLGSPESTPAKIISRLHEMRKMLDYSGKINTLKQMLQDYKMAG